MSTPGSTTHIIAKSTTPVPSDCGLDLDSGHPDRAPAAAKATLSERYAKANAALCAAIAQTSLAP